MSRFECNCGEFDLDNINYECPRVWRLFSLGFVKGFFQLETSLGKSWAKRLKPENIQELSDLIALLRPGS